jgi:glucose-6-phosphate-specific signal transduction histidine kinase
MKTWFAFGSKLTGRGFDNTKAGLGFGLTSMRQRTSEIGGNFELTSRPGNGARIEVRVPLRPLLQHRLARDAGRLVENPPQSTE